MFLPVIIIPTTRKKLLQEANGFISFLEGGWISFTYAKKFGYSNIPIFLKVCRFVEDLDRNVREFFVCGRFRFFRVKTALSVYFENYSRYMKIITMKSLRLSCNRIV